MNGTAGGASGSGPGATGGSGSTPSAANIQGSLHIGRYLGGDDDEQRRKKKRKLKKADAKSLYIHRPVVNSDQIIAWAKANGFATTLPADDLHVTQLYSKKPLDWDAVGQPAISNVGVPPSQLQFNGARSITQFNEATVLRFESDVLANRWRSLLALGASSDYPEYHPHITISYNAPPEAALREPYRGPIVLGPEVYAEIAADGFDPSSVVEKANRAGDLPELTNHGSNKVADGSITFSWLSSTGRGITHTMPLLSPKEIVDLVKQRMARFKQAGPHSRESDSSRCQRKYIAAHPGVVLHKAWDLGDKDVRAEMAEMFNPDSHHGTSDPAWLQDNTKPSGTVIGDDGTALGVVPAGNVGRDALVQQDYKDQIDWASQMMEKIGARHSKSDVKMIQDMHDNAVHLGASCNGHKNSSDGGDDNVEQFKIAKVDESLGLVFGYAIICKVNGQDYYDLNIDPNGNRTPEHIPENTMLKAAADFMQNSRAGNEMHSGSEQGTYVFAMPWTTDIAKAFGVSAPKVTGLMVCYKPPKSVLAKFLDGTYTGFSIEGGRVAVQEFD
jgi:hypothetical protein